MIKLTNLMREMYKSGECDKVINTLKKQHKYIEMRKAKQDKKLLGIVATLCDNGSRISHIPFIRKLKSVEMVKDLYCLYEMEILKELKND